MKQFHSLSLSLYIRYTKYILNICSFCIIQYIHLIHSLSLKQPERHSFTHTLTHTHSDLCHKSAGSLRGPETQGQLRHVEQTQPRPPGPTPPSLPVCVCVCVCVCARMQVCVRVSVHIYGCL